MSKKKGITLPPLTPDFSKPVPSAEVELLRINNEHLQRIVNNLRRDCGEYKRVIKLLQHVAAGQIELLKPQESK